MAARISPMAVIAAAPSLGMGAYYLATWIAPLQVGASAVPDLILVMLLEFIIIHSSLYMGSVAFSDAPRGEKARSVIMLGLFYSLFAGGFSLAFGVVWPFFAFWALTANRMLGPLIGQAPTGKEKTLLTKGWIIGALFYIVFVTVAMAAPTPRLGFSGAAMAQIHIPGSGDWVSKPWTAIAFGFMYFTATGISELFSHAWLPAKNIKIKI